MPRPAAGPHLFWSERRERWYVRWTRPGTARSRERSTGTSDARAAQQRLKAFDPAAGAFREDRERSSVRAANAAIWTPETLTVPEALRWYWERRGRKTKAAETVRFAMLHLLDWWGDRAVCEIGDETVEAYREWRESGCDRPAVKPATVDRELTVLKAAVRARWKAGKLTRLPGFPKAKKREGRDFALNEAAVDRFLGAADQALPHVRLFVYLGLFTAARQAALLELRWEQIDLDADRPMIRLNPPGRDQTAKGRATVPIAKRLLPLLREARAAAESAGTLELPVIHWRGRGLTTIRTAFRTLAVRAGFAVTGPSKLTPHVLRHTAATIMARRRVPLSLVAAWLGQTIERTTAVYIHHTPDHFEQARAALDREEWRPRLVEGGLAVVGGLAG